MSDCIVMPDSRREKENRERRMCAYSILLDALNSTLICGRVCKEEARLVYNDMRSLIREEFDEDFGTSGGSFSEGFSALNLCCVCSEYAAHQHPDYPLMYFCSPVCYTRLIECNMASRSSFNMKMREISEMQFKVVEEYRVGDSLLWVHGKEVKKWKFAKVLCKVRCEHGDALVTSEHILCRRGMHGTKLYSCWRCFPLKTLPSKVFTDLDKVYKRRDTVNALLYAKMMGCKNEDYSQDPVKVSDESKQRIMELVCDSTMYGRI